MAIKDYHELRVYNMAFDSAMAIFHSSKRWPSEERYSLTSQIRRSSRSVCANLAEAWRKRRYPAAFVAKMSDADTEAGETIVWLDFALKCEYLPEKECCELKDAYNYICAQLVTMINQSEKWCMA
jgi:four helix bundle protein